MSVYVKRCLERLKLGRERQVAEQRQIRVVDTIKQVMDEEMATMATEDGIEMQDLVDFLLTVEEELRQEGMPLQFGPVLWLSKFSVKRRSTKIMFLPGNFLV